MSTSNSLRDIFEAGRPLIEQSLDIAEQIAALRDVATDRGLDWSQVKALLKAQIQDERDEAGEGKRVRRIVEKAEFASAYADMLGLAKMNEKKFSEEQDQLDSVPGPEESREDASMQASVASESDPAPAGSLETAAIISEPARATPPLASGGKGEAGTPLPGPASPTISVEEDIPEFLRRTA